MFQNRSSSAESAHANAEASVSRHRLDSGGKSMKWVSKEEGIFLSQEKMGLRTFLRDWNDFAANTEVVNVGADQTGGGGELGTHMY